MKKFLFGLLVITSSTYAVDDVQLGVLHSKFLNLNPVEQAMRRIGSTEVARVFKRRTGPDAQKTTMSLATFKGLYSAIWHKQPDMEIFKAHLEGDVVHLAEEEYRGIVDVKIEAGTITLSPKTLIYREPQPKNLYGTEETQKAVSPEKANH